MKIFSTAPPPSPLLRRGGTTRSQRKTSSTLQVRSEKEEKKKKNKNHDTAKNIPRINVARSSSSSLLFTSGKRKKKKSGWRRSWPPTMHWVGRGNSSLKHPSGCWHLTENISKLQKINRGDERRRAELAVRTDPGNTRTKKGILNWKKICFYSDKYIKKGRVLARPLPPPAFLHVRHASSLPAPLPPPLLPSNHPDPNFQNPNLTLLFFTPLCVSFQEPSPGSCKFKKTRRKWEHLNAPSVPHRAHPPRTYFPTTSLTWLLTRAT